MSTSKEEFGSSRSQQLHQSGKDPKIYTMNIHSRMCSLGPSRYHLQLSQLAKLVS